MIWLVARPAVLCVLLLAALEFSCVDAVDSADPKVEVAVATDQDSYGTNEPIEFELRVTNGTEQDLIFDFSSGQRYDFAIETAGGEVVWRWSADQAFIMIIGREQLEPGESLTYRERFEDELPPGEYNAVGALVASNEQLEARTTFRVIELGARSSHTVSRDLHSVTPHSLPLTPQPLHISGQNAPNVPPVSRP